MPHPVAAVIAALALVATLFTATAQNYPARPVKVIVGFAAGSGPDVLARTVASQLSAEKA